METRQGKESVTDTTDRVRVGVVGGYRLPGNVRTLLVNFRRLLSGRWREFHCDLLLAADVEPPEGYAHRELPSDGPATARGKLLGLTREIRRYVRERHPDVLFQLTRFPTHGTATAVAGRLTGTRTVTRMAGLSFHEHRFAESLGERLRLRALKNWIGLLPVHLSDEIVVLGPRARRALSRRGRTDGVHEIPQPVDTDTFHPVSRDERAAVRERLDMPPLDGGRVLLTVGRVTQRKGIQALRRTARALSNRDRPVRWYVAGDGPLRDSLETVPNVVALGRVDHDHLPDYYRAADLYVHPSLHEGLPNVLLEATACGTPSVARDVGECDQLAAATFEDDDRLVDLVTDTYDRVELEDRFRADHLAPEYETLLSG